jgi:hypothetical protein
MHGIARFLSALALLGLSVPVAAASYRSSVPGFSNFSVNRQLYSNRAALRGALEAKRSAPGKPTKGGSSDGLTGRAGGKAALSFRPQSGMLAPKLLAAQAAKTSEDRAAFEREFTDALASYRERLRANGGAQNDAARAAAYLVLVSYVVALDRPDYSAAELSAVRAQLEQVFLANPEFLRKSDREKQVELETYAIMATWIDATAHLLKEAKEERAMRAVREAARASFEDLMGVSPDRVRISRAGATLADARG